MKKFPCLQELPPTEPVDQGDEGEWDTMGEATGSRSPAPTVEELLAKMERQPLLLRGARSPLLLLQKKWWPQKRRRALHPLLLLQKIAPLVDRLKEAPSWLVAYVKHLAKSIPNQVLAFMKSYFPKAPVDVVRWRTSRQLYRRAICGAARADRAHCGTSRRQA
jgi:hypothetical protein